MDWKPKTWDKKNSIVNLMDQHSYTLKCNYYIRVYRPGGALLLLVFKQKLKLPLNTSNMLRMVENGLEMKKLWPPK